MLTAESKAGGARINKTLIDISVKDRLTAFWSLVVPIPEPLFYRYISSQSDRPADEKESEDVVSDFDCETEVAEWVFASGVRCATEIIIQIILRNAELSSL